MSEWFKPWYWNVEIIGLLLHFQTGFVDPEEDTRLILLE